MADDPGARRRWRRPTRGQVLGNLALALVLAALLAMAFAVRVPTHFVEPSSTTHTPAPTTTEEADRGR